MPSKSRRTVRAATAAQAADSTTNDPTTSPKGSRGRASVADASKAAAAEKQPPQQEGAAAPSVEPTTIPAGITPEGIEVRVVDPSALVWDPEIESGREAGEYERENPKMGEMIASMTRFASERPQGHGNDTAIVARKGANGELLIVHGRRRHAAAGFAGVKLLVEIRDMSLREARIAATVENIQREQVSELGEARQFRDLRDKEGMTEREIAAEVGKLQGHVNKRLAVLAMPEWVVQVIAKGQLTASQAYEGLNWFTKLPDPAGSEAWATLARRWDSIRTALTAARLKNEMGQIVRVVTRPLDPAHCIGGEPAPLFDRAAHDAACDCGGKAIRLQEHIKPKARCSNPTVWERLQEEAREARRAAIQSTAKAAAKSGKASAAPQPVRGADSIGNPTFENEARAAGPIYSEPTWKEFAKGHGTAAESLVLVRDFVPDAAVPTGTPDLDWRQLPADSVRFVQSPAGNGSFRLVCTDADALRRAKRAAVDMTKERAEQMREQDRAAFRAAAANANLRNPVTVAALIAGVGEASPGFGASTARMLGIDYDSASTVAELAALPKKELSLLMRGVAFRLEQGETGWHHDDAFDRARNEVRSELAEDFATLFAAVPLPVREDGGAQDAPAGEPAEPEGGAQAEQEAGAQDAPAGEPAEPEGGAQAEQEAGAQDAPAGEPVEPEGGAQAEQEAGAQDAPAGEPVEPEGGAQAEQEAGAQDAPAGEPVEPEGGAQAEQEAGAQDAPAGEPVEPEGGAEAEQEAGAQDAPAGEPVEPEGGAEAEQEAGAQDAPAGEPAEPEGGAEAEQEAGAQDAPAGEPAEPDGGAQAEQEAGAQDAPAGEAVKPAGRSRVARSARRRGK